MPAAPPAPARKCPICGKLSAASFAPFCSARCQDVDLNRWLSGRYRVETDEAPKENGISADGDED